MTSNRYSQLLKTPEFRAFREELTKFLNKVKEDHLAEAITKASKGNDREAAANLTAYNLADGLLDEFNNLLDRQMPSTAPPNASMSYNDTV